MICLIFVYVLLVQALLAPMGEVALKAPTVLFHFVVVFGDVYRVLIFACIAPMAVVSATNVASLKSWIW